MLRILLLTLLKIAPPVLYLIYIINIKDIKIKKIFKLSIIIGFIHGFLLWLVYCISEWKGHYGIKDFFLLLLFSVGVGIMFIFFYFVIGIILNFIKVQLKLLIMPNKK